MRRIAEFKRQSPWDGSLTDLTLTEVVCRYDQDPEIWGISIVVDEAWGGDITDLFRARDLTEKPILARGLKLRIPEIFQTGGADFVLTYSRFMARAYPGLAWLEVHTIMDLPDDPRDWPLVVIANNRDVKTGQLHTKAANQILHYVKEKQPATLVCAASGYESFEAIPPEYDMGLIGTALLKEIV